MFNFADMAPYDMTRDEDNTLQTGTTGGGGQNQRRKETTDGPILSPGSCVALLYNYKIKNNNFNDNHRFIFII